MRIFKAIVITVCLSGTLFAQAATLTIEAALLARSRGEVSVEFSHSLAPGGPHLDVNRVHIRNAPGVTVTSITQSLVEKDVLTVVFAGELPAAQAPEICFESVRFLVATAVNETTDEVCRALGSAAEVAAAKAAVLKTLQDVPLAARDKDVFASGFVTTSSKESAGGADLSLNPDFKIPNLQAFVQIKKATAEDGDAKNFEAGARYRYTRTWKPGQMKEIAEIAARPLGRNELLTEKIRARQQNIIAGWIVDVAGKLEGEPTNFDVTNFVVESGVRVHTMTKGFVGRKGFWRGFVLPAGVEVGQSLGTTAATAPAAAPAAPAAAPPVNRIARYKAGAGFTVYYDNPGTQLFPKHIELDVNGVMRHLFLTESRFNAETKKIDTTDKGLTGYTQVDLKVFFVDTDSGRFGFKLSFNRGRLPPVYAEVKSFDFGFVIESGDDHAKKTAERNASAPARP